MLSLHTRPTEHPDLGNMIQLVQHNGVGGALQVTPKGSDDLKMSEWERVGQSVQTHDSQLCVTDDYR